MNMTVEERVWGTWGSWFAFGLNHLGRGGGRGGMVLGFDRAKVHQRECLEAFDKDVKMMGIPHRGFPFFTATRGAGKEQGGQSRTSRTTQPHSFPTQTPPKDGMKGAKTCELKGAARPNFLERLRRGRLQGRDSAFRCAMPGRAGGLKGFDLD